MTNPALDLLFEDLAHPNPYIQNQAFAVMIERWPAESLPRLMLLLSQPDIILRRAAVRAIGAFGAPALLPLAEVLNESSDSTVKTSCVKAYAQAAGNYPGIDFPNEVMVGLEKALMDESPIVGVATVMALGQLGRQGVPLLLGAIKGSNPAQGVAAINALSQIDLSGMREEFIVLLERNELDSYVRESLKSAISCFSNDAAR